MRLQNCNNSHLINQNIYLRKSKAPQARSKTQKADFLQDQQPNSTYVTQILNQLQEKQQLKSSLKNTISKIAPRPHQSTDNNQQTVEKQKSSLFSFVDPQKLNQMFTLPSPQSLTKTFVFQKQQTQQSTFIESEVSPHSTLIDISSLLILHCPPTQFKVSIYDPQSNKFISLQKIKAQNGLVPRHFLEPSVILIRFRKIEQKLEDQNLQSSFELDSKLKKDVRSKQRTIREAIALVKRWRQLNTNSPKPGNSKKKMNLQEAAREIGISKKSLDDYYCQLRLAELHNFNFTENMDQRMGKLRSYVKEHRTDQSIRIRHHKHPKNLKVIEQFVVDKKMEEYILHQKELGDQSRMKEESEAAQLQLENPFLNEFTSHKFFENIEDDYYKGFQFLLDEPSDPFLCDNRNLSKRMFEDESEGSLFF